MSTDIGKAKVKVEFDEKSVQEQVEQTKGGLLGKLGNLGTLGGAALAAGIGAGALGAGKALYEMGSTFDDVADTIRVGTGATGKALDGLVGSAKNIGRDIPASFDEIGQTVADLNTRLGLTGPTLETLSKQFLEAGRITGQALDINTVTSALSAFNVKGADTTKAMDDLFRVSQATGIGMNELAAALKTGAPNLTQFGFSIGESASLLGTLDKAGLDGNRTVMTLSRAMVEFAKKGKEPKQALKDTVGQIEAFTKSGNDAAAINLAAKIFGTRGASQFVAAVKSGKVNLDQLMESTGATSDTILGAAKDTADFSESWQIFKNKALLAVEPVATRVFNALGQGMAWLNENAGPTISRIVDLFNQWKPVIIGVGVAMGALLVVTQAHAAVLAVQAAGGLAAYISQIGVVQAVTKTWAAVQWVINAALSANPIGIVVVAIAAFVGAIILAWKNSETFRDIVTGAWNGIKAVVGAVVGWFTTAVPAAWESVKAATSSAWNAVKSATSTAWNAVKTAVSVVVDAIKSYVESRVKIVIATWDLLSSLPGKVGAFFGKVKDAISEKLGDAVAFVKGIPKKLVDALGNLDRLLYDAGLRLIGGLISGITDKIGDVGKAMGKVASKIKSYLPGSPIKTGPLTSWNNGGAGKRLVGLLADGLSDTRPVDRAMTSLASSIDVPGLTVPIGPSVRAGSVSSGGGVFQVTVPVVIDRREVGRASRRFSLDQADRVGTSGWAL